MKNNNNISIIAEIVITIIGTIYAFLFFISKNEIYGIISFIMVQGVIFSRLYIHLRYLEHIEKIASEPPLAIEQLEQVLMENEETTLTVEILEEKMIEMIAEKERAVAALDEAISTIDMYKQEIKSLKTEVIGLQSLAKTADETLIEQAEEFQKYKEKYQRYLANNLIHRIDKASKLLSTAAVGELFEKTVCTVLEANDFTDVRKTVASGDNGIDVFANRVTKGEKSTFAIQCKCYSNPVGNHAIQEAYSGAAFFDKECAAVITNNTFTDSAKTAARKLNVILFDRRIFVQMVAKVNIPELMELIQMYDRKMPSDFDANYAGESE